LGWSGGRFLSYWLGSVKDQVKVKEVGRVAVGCAANYFFVVHVDFVVVLLFVLLLLLLIAIVVDNYFFEFDSKVGLGVGQFEQCLEFVYLQVAKVYLCVTICGEHFPRELIHFGD
jgi:hypothetical protein